jgi:glycyl-tRNA synthetase beta chain
MAAGLANVTFHNKLGSQADRIARIAALAREIAPLVGAAPDLAAEAARVCQGRPAIGDGGRVPRVAGDHGALLRPRRRPARGVWRRLPEHYQPLGPSTPCPPTRVGRRGAGRQDRHADGLLGHRREAHGAKDPYALRRAALGVIRLVLENGVREWLHAEYFSLESGVDAVVFHDVSIGIHSDARESESWTRELDAKFPLICADC